MHHFLYVFCVTSFYALPATLVGWRWLRPKSMPWWLVVVADMVVGWVFILASYYFDGAYLLDLMRPYGDNPPQELVDRWSDGEFNLVLPLGFVVSLVYLIPWVGFYALIQYVHRFFNSRAA